MSNPFAQFVNRMDALVPSLEAGTLSDDDRTELVDLIRRAMFALVNHINAQAQYMEALILPVEEPEPSASQADLDRIMAGGTEGTEGTSLEESS